MDNEDEVVEVEEQKRRTIKELQKIVMIAGACWMIAGISILIWLLCMR